MYPQQIHEAYLKENWSDAVVNAKGLFCDFYLRWDTILNDAII